MVFIRTDANESVATGHLMRCRTIAKKIKQLGERVVFIFRDMASIEVLAEQEEYIILQRCDGVKNNEVQQMISILRVEKNAKLVLDLYEFDAWYMDKLKSYARIITFDDMFQEKFPADVIINYNLYYTEFNYGSRYEDTNTKLLLGADYVPIRDEFLVEDSDLKRTVSTILLICGGGDKYHVLINLLKKICKKDLQNKYKFIVIAGILNEDLIELRNLSRHEKNIEIFENVKNMADFMKKSDVIVSAASTVLYECCCMKKPTIFFTVADNQTYDIKAFSKNDMMRYAGDIRDNFENVLNEIVVQLESVADDFEIRIKMSEKMENVVDGKGAMRIAEEIVKIGE